MKPGASDRKWILVVDSDELVRWSAAEELKEYGYPVVVAADARGALQRGPGAAVALLDDAPPGVDGLALAGALRRRHQQCAIVLMTADVTRDLRRRAREQGVFRILAKPFSLETLVAAIREAQEGPVTPSAEPAPKRVPSDGEPSTELESAP